MGSITVPKPMTDEELAKLDRLLDNWVYRASPQYDTLPVQTTMALRERLRLAEDRERKLLGELEREWRQVDYYLRLSVNLNEEIINLQKGRK